MRLAKYTTLQMAFLNSLGRQLQRLPLAKAHSATYILDSKLD